MLVLTRKEGESVRIGNVFVEVKNFHAGKCQLVIHAPKETEIVRTEIESAGTSGSLCKDVRHVTKGKSERKILGWRRIPERE